MMSPPPRLRRTALTPVLALMLAGALVGVAGAAQATPAAAPQAPKAASLAPVIKHTGKAPTGYTATFSLYAPDADRVQIKGEWFFERPSELTQLAGTPAAPVVQTQGILPADWQPGDVPIAFPNATAANWPVIDMQERGNSGVWEWTTPLPSGVFSYGYFVDCASDAGTGCTQLADPSNLGWDAADETLPGTRQASSQVFVPSDSAFDTVEASWLAPSDEQGSITHHVYSSPGHVTPANQNYLTIYTPPGYDAERAEPYPTLYLQHGGGGNETDWTTQGAAGDILDNLIATGQIEPMVVVMPNNGGYPSSTFNEAFDRDLIDNMLPYVEANFAVSTDAADRAFAGLSAGGIVTNSFMLKYPETFQYYGMMSAGLPPAFNTLTEAQAVALRDKSIQISGGWQDPIHAVGFGQSHTGPARQVTAFTNAGIAVSTNFINGGHEWYVWRILLKDFLTGVAFQPPAFADWAN
ncbi:alpha/beta hydrolase-fold protein [Microbacterium sp. 2FI]|uniref:alpha/beta hydrolase-fold protein n=1 Tax=Microbacterium sp. 2FI TaxID=2502193 RepID=UPI0010F7C0C0|nr:alpha/beta hydrolase-fold protein [Microbacterium sp. 2FI]